MPPWAGFLAAIVEFILGNIGKIRFDRSLDGKKAAAIALLKLHDALGRHDILARQFLASCEGFMAGAYRRLYRAEFAGLAESATFAATAFGAAIHQLHQVLMRYDPRLSLVFMGIIKSGSETSAFLQPMYFRLVPMEEAVFAIGYTAPTEQLLHHDFQASRNAVMEELPIEPETLVDHARVYSRTDYLLDLVRAGMVEGVIQADRIDQLEGPYRAVEEQLPTVTRTLKELRRYIQKRVVVADMLHPSLNREAAF